MIYLKYLIHWIDVTIPPFLRLMSIMKCLLRIFFFLVYYASMAQTDHDSNSLLIREDTIDHSLDKKELFIPKPKKAALYSAVFPGAGQFYNRHYIKIPFLYAGLGYFIYRSQQNRGNYQCFQRTYKNALFNGLIPDDIRCNGKIVDIRNFNTSGLKQRRDAYRKNMELAYIGAGVLYLFNILDAYVDAHLQSFDISEDLSLQLSPRIMPDYSGQNSLGFVARWTF